MVYKRSFGPLSAVFLLSVLGAAAAQTPALHPTGKDPSAGVQVSRLAGDWRSSPAVVIPASGPQAHARSLGMAPAGTRLERMLLLLDPSAGRQQALVTELQNQQNPRSPEFHHWLTPAAFAAAYGNSLADVSEVCAWLQSQGFKVAPLPAGLGWIEFSGTAGQVEQAFHAKVESAAASAGTETCACERNLGSRRIEAGDSWTGFAGWDRLSACADRRKAGIHLARRSCRCNVNGPG